MKPVLLFGLGALLVGASCSSSTSLHERTHFSRTDSLTDMYLVMQDSLVQSWNRLVRFEIDRSAALGSMIDQLQHSTVIDESQTRSYHVSLEQIERMRFTQKSMVDPHVIEEYDKACAELMQKLSSLGDATAVDSSLRELEKLHISNTQQRRYYDSIATKFNSFIKVNWAELKELGGNIQLEPKARFVTVEER